MTDIIKPVTMWRTSDGATYITEAIAKQHEARLDLERLVYAAEAPYGEWDDARVVEWLIENASAIIAGLQALETNKGD